MIYGIVAIIVGDLITAVNAAKNKAGKLSAEHFDIGTTISIIGVIAIFIFGGIINGLIWLAVGFALMTIASWIAYAIIKDKKAGR
jgi:hypothetical protein